MSSSPAVDWFHARTSHAAEYDPRHLAELKTASDTSVSVVLPARDEAPTIGGVVTAVATLGGGLVDEIVVVDAGSKDATAEAAVAAGARVHQADMLLPQFGPSLGKGDSLWRSLSVTGGDIVVFLDTDVRNPDPRFVTGLLGPLLTDPSVELVKAFYDRPVTMERVQHPTGGGRVTELCARPLLNLFWPELAGLVQPLSGEYAGRRRLLESLPFFTGYGVEFGMLVDTLRMRGALAIAQVDLDVRVHRNQGLEALSRMAFGILQVAMRRLASPAPHPLVADGPESLPYVQFARMQAGFDVMVDDVEICERPPLRSVA